MSAARRALAGLGLLALGVAALGIPVVVAQLAPPWFSPIPHSTDLPLQLFACTGSVALALFGALRIRRQSGRPAEDQLPLVAGILVGLFFLALAMEYGHRSWDYDCYEGAAKAVLAGTPLYGSGYIYPPLLAEGFATLHRVIGFGLSHAPIHVRSDADSVWHLVLYVFQCLQVGLAIAAYVLCLAFARRLGLRPLAAAALACALVVFDNPLLRTLKHDQMNLWILDLSLAAMLLADRHPWPAGLAVSLGAHLKLYPIILLGPWLLERRWRACLGAAAGVAGILLVETRGGRDWTRWHDFVAAMGSLGGSPVAFRDNSVRGMVTSTLRLATGSTDRLPDALQAAANVVVALATLGAAGWLVARFLRRERDARSAQAATGAPGPLAGVWRRDGHMVDALAFSLLAAPLVWEHHYVLAIPLVIWAIATRIREHPWLIGGGTLLMLAVPTIDVYPLGYHRLAGLILVLIGTGGRARAVPARTA